MHNFTTRRNSIPKDLHDPSLRWGESTVEWSYTVLAQIERPFAARPVSVLFRHGGLVPRFHDDHIVFYGREGAIHLKGHSGSGQLSLWGRSESWEGLPLPEDIAATIPDVAGEVEQCWHSLARAFVKDIGGEAVDPYPTFRESSAYQQLIDLIRENDNWTDVSGLT